MITYGSLFSGIGGFDLAFDRAGMVCQWQVEKDKKASLVLAKHWTDIPRHTDVCDVGKHNLTPVDVICGGFPCQDLSVAGPRGGFVSGERSVLFFEMVRITDELRPAFLVWENVPGLLSSHKGRDFARVLLALDEIGYHGVWTGLDARFFGLAQRRLRIFGVFARRDIGIERCSEILALPARVSRDAEPGHKKRKGSAGTTKNGLGDDRRTGVVGPLQASTGKHWGGNQLTEAGHIIADTFVFGGNNTSGEINVAPALNAKGGTGRIDFESEAFVVQAQNDSAFVFESGFVRNGRGSPDIIAPPLKAESSSGDSIPLVVAFHGQASSQQSMNPSDDSPVLGATKRVDVLIGPTIFDERNITSKTSQSRFSDELPAGTVHQVPLTVVQPFQESQSGLRVGGDTHATLDSNNGSRRNIGIVDGYIIRRLTPTECARLQGFPDNWLDGQSDSSKYRQLGNAVAVPVVEWIARGLVRMAEEVK